MEFTNDGTAIPLVVKIDGIEIGTFISKDKESAFKYLDTSILYYEDYTGLELYINDISVSLKYKFLCRKDLSEILNTLKKIIPDHLTYSNTEKMLTALVNQIYPLHPFHEIYMWTSKHNLIDENGFVCRVESILKKDNTNT